MSENPRSSARMMRKLGGFRSPPGAVVPAQPSRSASTSAHAQRHMGWSPPTHAAIMFPVVPELRIEACNDDPVRPGGDYVLYWMIASRRAAWNYGLQRAVDRAVELRKPL